jgi:hypothetical protein
MDGLDVLLDLVLSVVDVCPFGGDRRSEADPAWMAWAGGIAVIGALIALAVALFRR